MIYRSRSDYQHALETFIASKKQHEAEIKKWSAMLEKVSDPSWVPGACVVLCLIGASVTALAKGMFTPPFLSP